MAIVTKFGIGLFNARNDATAYSELYHTDIGSETPGVRLGFMIGTTTPGVNAPNNHFSFGTTVTSTNGSIDAAYGAFRNRDNLSAVDRDSASNNGVDGPGWIEPAAQTIYQTNPRSPVPGGWNVVPQGSNFVSSPLYIGATMVGSYTGFSQWMPLGSISSGTTAAVSMGFTPDVVFTFGMADWQQLGFFVADKVVANMGIIDCRTLARQHGVNWAFWNITNKNPITRVDAGSGFFAQPTASGQLTARWKMRVTSTDANGFHTQVWANDFSESSSMYLITMGLKFEEAGAHFHTGVFSLGGVNGVNTLQTNSLIPQFLYAIGTLVRSLNWSTASHDEGAGTISVGFATADNGERFATFSEQSSLNVTNNFTYANSNHLLNMFGAGSIDRYQIRLPSFGANGVSFTEAISPGLYGGAKIMYFAFGESTDAATHLQAEDGSSIFLHGQQFGDDLLLLIPPVAETGLPVKRDFPLDDDRDYPTRINTIRDFPET